jgi:hypothetical protein
MSQPQRLADPTPPGHRPAPHADVPRVHSLEAVGLQLSRHLARSRRQGAPDREPHGQTAPGRP